MIRFRAALIHLFISLVVIGLFIGVVFFIWYPKPLYSIAHVIEPLKLFRIDLSLVALLQISALSYGVYTIYKGRFSIIVFADGRFNYLIEKFSNEEQLNSAELKRNFLLKQKPAYLPKLKTMDMYAIYAGMLPLTDYNILKPYALSVATMKSKFQSNSRVIDELNF